MPAYDTDDAFAASFVALVEPWLRDAANAATFDFSQLHYALDGLQYLLTADRTGVERTPTSDVRPLGACYCDLDDEACRAAGHWKSSPAPPTAHVKCSMHDCAITSAVPDACLLNFAPRGAAPLWFCRAHHPAVAGLPPPGYTPPRKLDPLA